MRGEVITKRTLGRGRSVLAKSQCAMCGQWFEDFELDDHLNQHLEAPSEEPENAQKRLKCPTCDKMMDAYYGAPFRVGGTEPGMRLLIGLSSSTLSPKARPEWSDCMLITTISGKCLTHGPVEPQQPLNHSISLNVD